MGSKTGTAKCDLCEQNKIATSFYICVSEPALKIPPSSVSIDVPPPTQEAGLTQVLSTKKKSKNKKLMAARGPREYSSRILIQQIECPD